MEHGKSLRAWLLRPSSPLKVRSLSWKRPAPWSLSMLQVRRFNKIISFQQIRGPWLGFFCTWTFFLTFTHHATNSQITPMKKASCASYNVWWCPNYLRQNLLQTMVSAVCTCEMSNKGTLWSSSVQSGCISLSGQVDILHGGLCHVRSINVSVWMCHVVNCLWEAGRPQKALYNAVAIFYCGQPY